VVIGEPMLEDPAYQGLLADILANTQDDTPRLVLADWLDEHSFPERAEFIRVQCEVARLPAERRGGLTVWVSDEAAADAVRADDPRAERLRRREVELLDAHAREWFRVPGLSAPGAGSREALCWWPEGDSRGERVVMEGTPRRGFVEAVTCRTDAWLEHGPAVVASHPFVKVRLTDWHAEREARSHGRPCWHLTHWESTPLDALVGACWHNTEAGALAALSAACVAIGRAEAKKLRREEAHAP
jgi:uncharacterized protein (TIGR02996 family)